MCSLGEKSPLPRIYDLNGEVLYLGTTHPTSTSLHLAEYWADLNLEMETKASAVLVDGERKWVQWEDINFDDEDFSDCSAAFEREHPDAFNTGCVGVGNAKFLNQRSLVDFGVEWFETSRE